MKFKLRAE